MPWPQSTKRVDGLNIIPPIFQVLAPGAEHTFNNRQVTALLLPDALGDRESQLAAFWLVPRCRLNPRPRYVNMDVPTLPVSRLKVFLLQSPEVFFGICLKSRAFPPPKSDYAANNVIFPPWDGAHLQPDHPLAAWMGHTRGGTLSVGAYLGSDPPFPPSI